MYKNSSAPFGRYAPFGVNYTDGYLKAHEGDLCEGSSPNQIPAEWGRQSFLPSDPSSLEIYFSLHCLVHGLLSGFN